MLAAPSAANGSLAKIYGMLPESLSLNPVLVGPLIWNVAVVPLPGQPATFEFVRQGVIPMRMPLRAEAMSAPFLSNLTAVVTTEGDTRFVCTSGAAVVMFNNGDGQDVFEAPFTYGMQIERQIRTIAGGTEQAQRDAMDRIIGGDPYYPQYYGSIEPGFELLIPSVPGGFIFEVMAGATGAGGAIDFASYDAGGARVTVDTINVPGDRLRRIRYDRVIGAGGAMAIGNQLSGMVNVYVNPIERTPTMANPFGATRIGQTRMGARPKVDDGGWTPIRLRISASMGSDVLITNGEGIRRIEYEPVGPGKFVVEWKGRRVNEPSLIDVNREYNENLDGFASKAMLSVTRGAGTIDLLVDRMATRPIIEGVNANLQVFDGDRRGPLTALRVPARAALAGTVRVPPRTALVLDDEPEVREVPWPARVLKPRAEVAAPAATDEGVDEARFQKLAIPPGPCDTCGGKDATFGGGRECWSCWRARVRRENDAAMAPSRAPVVITARKAPPSRAEERERRRATRALRVVRRERQAISRSQEYGAAEFFPTDDEDYEPASARAYFSINGRQVQPFEEITYEFTKPATEATRKPPVFNDAMKSYAETLNRLMQETIDMTFAGIAGPVSPPVNPAQMVDAVTANTFTLKTDVSSTPDGGNQAGAVRARDLRDDLRGIVQERMTDAGPVEIRPDDRPRMIVGSVPEVDQADVANLRATTLSIVADFEDVIEDQIDAEGMSQNAGRFAWALLSGCALGGIWDRDMEDAVTRMVSATTAFNWLPEPGCSFCGTPAAARCSLHRIAGVDPAEILITARQPRRPFSYLSGLQAFALGAIVDFWETLSGLGEASDESFVARDLGRRAWNEIRRWAAFNGQDPSNYPIEYRRFLAKLSRRYNSVPNKGCTECGLSRWPRCNRCRVQIPVDIYDTTLPSERDL